MTLHPRRSLLLSGVMAAATPLLHGQQASPSAAGVLPATDFGAKGDGASLDTRALQAAIDKAAEAGGGRVLLPAGRYLTGTLFLRSHVFLQLAPGATLLGSRSLADYPLQASAFRSYTDVYADQSILYAEGQRDLGIVGEGSIDGQGMHFAGLPNENGQRYKGRPYLIRMVQCAGVRVEGVTLRDSAMWVQHYLACEDLSIRGITVHSDVNRNNDGIDIDSCRNVRIADCNIFSGDDAIVLKATSNRPCENVTVTNCMISSKCNAFKLGTESNGGFRNVVFANSVVHNTRLSGVAIEMVDGGTLEQVSVSNLTMDGVGAPLFIRLGNRARPIGKGLVKPGVGSLRGVQISNVQARNASVVGCPFSGIPGHFVEDVTLRDVRLEFTGGGKAAHAIAAVPEEEASYPEHRMFGNLPAYGIYARHCRGLRMEGVELRYASADERPAMVLDDVQRVELLGASFRCEQTAIVLRNVRDAWVETRLEEFSSRRRLELRGSGCGGIRVRSASGVDRDAVIFADGAAPSALRGT